MTDRRGGLGRNAEIQKNTEELAKLNNKLERMLAKLGTRADNEEFRSRFEKDLKEVNALAKHLMQDINDAKKSSDRQVVGRLTQEFIKEYQRFQKINEQVKNKDSAMMSAVKDDIEHGRGGGAGGRGRGRSDADNGSDQQRQERLLEENIQFLEVDAEEIETRHQRILAIERDVLEVNEMFRDLQTMVNEQGESLTIIGDNITAAKDKAVEAHQELLTAENYQKKSRKKKCCILFILLAVVAAITIGIWAIS